MKKKFKILGLSIAVAAILALVIASTVGAAGDNLDTGTQRQNQGAECLCGQRPVVTAFVAIVSPSITHITTTTRTHRPDRAGSRRPNKGFSSMV